MNILLVYPYCPDTYWSYRNALRFISKKAAFPPLGLITVSAMLPKQWNKRLVDMNVTTLETTDILWADYVFISAMSIQRESAVEVIKLCKRYNRKVVAGGPLFTQDYMEYPSVEHIILNEAEKTLPPFLQDLEHNEALHLYQSSEFADLSTSPIPDYSLLMREKYASMSMQVARGCPFNCDFCEITSLLGHKVRMKSVEQVVDDMNMLYSLGWHGSVFIVDDNFIGSKAKVKESYLPTIKEWMIQHKYPFSFHTQASINLSDDDELMSLMVDAGFSSAFIGIETPVDDSLKSCNKQQNRNRDLIRNVKKIQKSGIEVSGGFIVGFDSDTAAVFGQQVDFIQKSGIVSAMVGLLNAPRNTSLYNRLKEENRILSEQTGNNTDLEVNFIPKMNIDTLLAGYKGLIKGIYSSKPYYKRVREFLRSYHRKSKCKRRFEFSSLKILVKSMFILGFSAKGQTEFWKLLGWTILHRPTRLFDALSFAVYGFHYRTVYGLNAPTRK